MSRILGPDGRPVDTSLLSKEVAIPTTIGVRAVHHETVASGLTPERLAYLLRQASIGNARDYLTLAEEMEERYLHYASQVQTRRLAIEGITPSLTVPKGVPARIADFVHEIVEDEGLREVIGLLTDGIAKGYAVVEPIWEYERGALRPVAYKWRDQRFFMFDPVAQTELRLAVDGSFEGEPLTKPTFMVHMPRSKAGIPIRRGFARAAAWAYLLQSYGLKDWAAFCEVYGLPLRVGKYHSGASDADRRTLLHALRSIASDAAAMIPDGMDIQFVEVQGAKGEAVFGGLLGYLDKQVSKLVVGQTMTSDDGSSMAQAKVHNEVRLDIQRADGVQLGNTCTRGLVRWAVAMNFGPQDVYPRLDLPVAEPEDVTALADGVSKLVPLGLKVAQKEMRAKFGLSEPAEGDELLGAPTAREPAPENEPVPAARRKPAAKAAKTATLAAHAGGCACPSCRPARAATLAADPRQVGPARLAGRNEDREQARGPAGIDVDDELDQLLEEQLADWEELADPLFAPLREALSKASSFDELAAMLPDVARRVDGSKLAERLARLTAIARGLGDVSD